MCGIAGIVDFRGRPVEQELLTGACDALRHRGPDDSGTWTDSQSSQCAGLAATRLAIIDPSSAGHQPMVREDGRYVLVFNGLIYNYRALRDVLLAEGARFTTRSDTEVALIACMRWGPDALSRFNGMWAMAFYDRQRGEGFLARDRFGIKPLVWAEHAGRFMFASEMRALRGLGRWPRDVDQGGLTQYLRLGYVSHPDTVYSAVRRLPPATYLPFGSGSVGSAVRYYTPPVRKASDAVPDRQEAAEHVRRAMFDAVARRRASDVPIGAFLSGGLDSSIVVAHLAELSSQPVKTFSVGWLEERAYDETVFARSVAERFGTDHYELKCRFSDVVAILPSILDHLGEPFFDSSILPTAIVSEFARRHVTVSLSGDGGDELFGGYWRYLAHGIYERYCRIPSAARRLLIEPMARAMNVSRSSLLSNRVRQFRKLLRARGDGPFLRHIAWSEILAPDARGLLRDCDGYDPTLDDCDETDALNRILLFDLQHSLPCDMLQKVDLASMYHSLEVRVPFLDPEVVAAATMLPSSMKIERGQTKCILRDAYRGVLPEEVLSRSKAGFEVPIGEFLRQELREMFLDTVTRDVVDSFGVIDFSVVRRIYDDHCARRAEHADLLFALLSLCWWRRGEGSVL